MSKSLGNVVDPLDVIRGIELQALHDKLLIGNLAPSEVKRATVYQKNAFPQGIPECGADALRFALIAYTTGGGDINFEIKVIHLYRRFCNKIWNACKYVLGKLEAVNDFVPAKQPALTGNESLSELWILGKMNYTAKAISEALEQRDFMKSANLLYTYWYFQLYAAPGATGSYARLTIHHLGAMSSSRTPRL
jgi:valyl-tRNA synthetase